MDVRDGTGQLFDFFKHYMVIVGYLDNGDQDQDGEHDEVFSVVVAWLGYLSEWIC